MSVATVRKCDVFETIHKVSQYRITVTACLENGDPAEAVEFDQQVDLCPRALKRLCRFVRRGLTPPRGGQDAPEPEGGVSEPADGE